MNDNPNCPFCGAEYENADELFDDFVDGDERDVECDECGKAFKVILNIHISFSTDPDPDFEAYLDAHPETRERLNEIKADNERRIKEMEDEHKRC